MNSFPACHPQNLHPRQRLYFSSRHRSVLNFLVHSMARLAAYTYLPKKPSLDLLTFGEKKQPKDLPTLLLRKYTTFF